MSNTKENEVVYAFGSPAATVATAVAAANFTPATVVATGTTAANDKGVKADKAGEGERPEKTVRKVKLPLKKLMNFRLSVFAAGATIAGIFCAENYLLGETVSAAVFLCAFVILCTVFLIFYTDYAEKSRAKRNFLFVLVFLLLFAVGAAGFTARFKAFSSRELGGHYYTVTGNVCSKTETSYGTALEIKNAFTEGVYKGETGYKIVLTVDGKTTADVGDKISFFAFLTEYSVVYDGKLAANRLAEGVKYRAEISASDIKILSHSPDIFQAANLFIKRALENGMTGDEFGVAYAMLTGGSEFIGDELLSAYRDLGIAHIFAVSGLHIGFFAAALSFVLKRCRVNRFALSALVILSSFFYSGVCGFSSSSLRAAIMCSVSFAASLSGKRYDGLSSLGVAATLVLVYSPAELFTAGFVLSFTIVAGLLIFAPALSRLFGKFLPKRLASSAAAVLAAFAFSVPVLLWSFGEISVLSVLVNLIFLPVVGILYVVLFVLTVLAGVFGGNTVLLFLPAEAIGVINYFATFAKGAALIVAGTAFGFPAAFWYASVVSASGIINLKRKAKIAVSIVLAAVFVIGTATVSTMNAARTEVYLCGSGKVSATIVKTLEGNSLILADFNASFSPSVIFRTAERKGITRLDTVYILSGDKNTDAQVALSVLRHCFDIENAVYFGERDEAMETIIKKIFKNISVTAMKDGEKIKRGGLIFSYVSEGRAAEIKTEKFFAAIAGKFGKNDVKTTDFKGGYDFAVCSDYAETLKVVLSPRKFYSFLYSERFTNVVSSGIISLRF